MNRDKNLVAIRPAVIAESNDSMSVDEIFQNDTLRPILKLQNDILIAIFCGDKLILKTEFKNKDAIYQKTIIANSLSKNNKLRNKLIGVVIGLFSKEEMSQYIDRLAILDKRIISMMEERLIDQLVS